MDPCNGSAPATGDIHLHIFKTPRMAPHTPTVCPEMATRMAVVVEVHDGNHGRRAWHRRQCVRRRHARSRLEALGLDGGTAALLQRQHVLTVVRLVTPVGL